MKRVGEPGIGTACPVLPALDHIILWDCSCLVTFLNLHPNFHLQRLFKIITQALLRVLLMIVSYPDGAELPYMAVVV